MGFERKFPRLVTLEELRRHGAAGGPLASMVLLRRGRLSVQRVTPAEFAFVCALADGP